nr:monodehydroascorbate reductase [Tanacetum cinerariifolium]
MQASLQGKENVIRQLKKQLSQLQVTRSDIDRTLRVHTIDSQITKLIDHVTHLQVQNDLVRAENVKIKQYYKELNNRDAHLDYLRHLKESVETIRDIVEEAKVVRPLDRSIVSACRYTKHSQELLEYAIGTCPQGSQPRAKQLAHIPLIEKKCPKASGSQPKSNPKPNRISPAKGVNKLPVEDQPRAKKSHVRTTNRVDSSSRLKRTRPTGRIFNLGNQCPLTRFTPPKVVSAKPNKKQASTCANQKEPIQNWGSNFSNSPPLSEEKSSVPPHNFPSMILQKIIWNSPICYKVVANQSDLVSNKFVTQSLTTTLSIENESLIEGENKMADVNAPSGQTPAMASPLRADDQISPHIRWVLIRKSNCYLDLEKSQSNPIYKIAVDLLKNTNFFRAFTASSTIPSIYIQQFWDTILYDKKDGCYRCQLDEQWFVLTKETLREALQITPVNNNKAFAAPPSIDGLIDFVNQLGYPKLVKNLSNVVTNDLFQPWRALLTIINLCLTGRPLDLKDQGLMCCKFYGALSQEPILIMPRGSGRNLPNPYILLLKTNRIWKKRATLIVIPSIRFTKLIIHHLQRSHRFHPRPDSPLHLPNEEPVLGYLKFSAKGTKREVFGMPIPGSLITAEIQQASYYREYMAKVAQHRRYLAGETGGVHDLPAPKPTQPARKPKTTAPKAPSRPSVLIPVRSAQPAPTSAPVKLQEKKRKQATETSDKPPKAKKSKHGWVGKKRSQKNVGASKTEEVPTVEPHVADEDDDYQKVLEESMKDAYALPTGMLPPVVIREPESEKYQPLPEVSGKGKAKVTEEQVAHDLLSLQKHKKTSPADQHIFQRRVSEPTGSSRHDESPYALLGQSDSEEESENVVLGAEEGGQDEG